MKITTKIIRIVSIVFAVVPVCMLLLFKVILKNYFDSFNITNYILFLIIEILNIIFAIIFFLSKDKIRKPLLALFIAYLIVTFLVPVYHLGRTFSPTGPDSYLMGLAFNEDYRDIYGVDITKLVKIYEYFK